MEEAISNFLNMVWDNFIYPVVWTFFSFLQDTLNADNNTYKILINWFFNIGRETPVDYFPNTSDFAPVYFIEDVISIIFFVLSLFLIYKLIKIIFKPIFKLFNVGGDIKWRR